MVVGNEVVVPRAARKYHKKEKPPRTARRFYVGQYPLSLFVEW